LQGANKRTWFAPVEEMSDKPEPDPRWTTHCAHSKFEHILKTFSLENFAKKWDNFLDKLSRLDFDMAMKILEKAKAALPNWPDFLDPESIKKMKVQ
jgi:hypothetical protein